MAGDFSVGATIVSGLVAAIYTLLAMLTNRFLLRRIDTLSEEMERMALQSTSGKRNNRYSCTVRASIQQASSRSMGDASSSSLHHHNSNHHHQNHRGRDSGLSQSSLTASLQETTARVARHALRRAIARDYVSWFFALIICFALTRSITVILSTLMMSPHAMEIGKVRGMQDVMFFPSSVLYYTVSIVLLHTFHYMSDAAAPKTLFAYRMRLGVALGVLWATAVMCLGLVLGGVSGDALEWASVAYGFVLAAAYLGTCVHIPNKVLNVSVQLSELARRIRVVSLVMAIALALRSVMLLPELQSHYGHLGSYGVAVSMPFDLLPVAISVWILHT